MSELYDQEVDLDDQFFLAFKAGYEATADDELSDSALWFLYQSWLDEA